MDDPAHDSTYRYVYEFANDLSTFDWWKYEAAVEHFEKGNIFRRQFLQPQNLLTNNWVSQYKPAFDYYFDDEIQDILDEENDEWTDPDDTGEI